MEVAGKTSAPGVPPEPELDPEPDPESEPEPEPELEPEPLPEADPDPEEPLLELEDELPPASPCGLVGELEDEQPAAMAAGSARQAARYERKATSRMFPIGSRESRAPFGDARREHP